MAWEYLPPKKSDLKCSTLKKNVGVAFTHFGTIIKSAITNKLHK